MDIHIIVATDDADELAQAERLITFLKSDLPLERFGREAAPPVPEEVLKVAVVAKTKKKAPPKADTRQTEIPGTEPKPAAPLPSPGDFSTPVLAAQSLARSRKDGVAVVTALVREFKVARVSEIPDDEKYQFIERAKALALETASS